MARGNGNGTLVAMAHGNRNGKHRVSRGEERTSVKSSRRCLDTGSYEVQGVLWKVDRIIDRKFKTPKKNRGKKKGIRNALREGRPIPRTVEDVLPEEVRNEIRNLQGVPS